MKKIQFAKEVIATRHYEVILEDFLTYHLREAKLWGNELDIYVKSGTNDHCITRVFSVTLATSELDLNFQDINNAKLVLKRHFGE